MWSFGPGPAPAGAGRRRHGERAGQVLEPDGRRDERARIDRARGIPFDRPVEAGRSAEDPDRGHVLERDGPRVDETRGAGEADQHDPPAGLDQVERERRGGRVVRRVDDRVEGKRRELVGRPDAVEPEAASEVAATARTDP